MHSPRLSAKPYVFPMPSNPASHPGNSLPDKSPSLLDAAQRTIIPAAIACLGLCVVGAAADKSSKFRRHR